MKDIKELFDELWNETHDKQVIPIAQKQHEKKIAWHYFKKGYRSGISTATKLTKKICNKNKIISSNFMGDIK